MTIEDLGNIGELLAAVGVIISLFYLALQLRANTAAMRSEGRDRNFDQMIVSGHPALVDKELMGVWLTGLEDPDKLDRVDLARFDRMLLERLVYIQLVYMRAVEIGDSHSLEVARRLLSPLLESRAAVDRWRRFTSRVEFKEFVDSMIEDNESGTA